MKSFHSQRVSDGNSIHDEHSHCGAVQPSRDRGRTLNCGNLKTSWLVSSMPTTSQHYQDDCANPRGVGIDLNRLMRMT